MVEIIVLSLLAALLGIVTIVFVFTSLRRKAKKKESAPVKEVPKEPAKAPEEFKISKKKRLARVSSKALKADSRTATIEPVYARTPEAPEAKDVYIDQSLSAESEQFLQQMSGTDAEGKQVVSLGELKKQQAAAVGATTNDGDKQVSDTYADKPWSRGEGLHDDDWSSMKARDLNIAPLATSEDFNGHFLGSYAGIKIGGGGSAKVADTKPQAASKSEEVPAKTRQPNFGPSDNPFGFTPPDMGPFGNPFGRPFGASSTPKPETDIDLGSAVIGEALLNRKGKPTKKTK